MPKQNPKAEPKSANKKKTIAELYLNLPVLPDTPDRPRYRPAGAAVDHLRERSKSLPDLPDDIDAAIKDLGEAMIEFNKKMDTDPTFREKIKKRIF